MNKEKICKNCKYYYVEEISFDYPQGCCNATNPNHTTEAGLRCDSFKYSDDYIKQLQQESEQLKQKLNWIAFGDDSELALRYLRKIGYVDFDEERKVYINKHNNEPFCLDDEEEKSYYIKDDELYEYTEQLEYKLSKTQEQKDLYKSVIDEINDYILNHELVGAPNEYVVNGNVLLEILDKVNGDE